MLGSLERPDIGDDGPTVSRFNARGVRIHYAKPVCHDVEEMLGRRAAQACTMIRRRRWKSALHDHAVAVAGKAMAGGTEDVEALPASFRAALPLPVAAP